MTLSKDFKTVKENISNGLRTTLLVKMKKVTKHPEDSPNSLRMS